MSFLEKVLAADSFDAAAAATAEGIDIDFSMLDAKETKIAKVAAGAIKEEAKAVEALLATAASTLETSMRRDVRHPDFGLSDASDSQLKWRGRAIDFSFPGAKEMLSSEVEAGTEKEEAKAEEALLATAASALETSMRRDVRHPDLSLSDASDSQPKWRGRAIDFSFPGAKETLSSEVEAGAEKEEAKAEELLRAAVALQLKPSAVARPKHRVVTGDGFDLSRVATARLPAQPTRYERAVGVTSTLSDASSEGSIVATENEGGVGASLPSSPKLRKEEGAAKTPKARSSAPGSPVSRVSPKSCVVSPLRPTRVRKRAESTPQREKRRAQFASGDKRFEQVRAALKSNAQLLSMRESRVLVDRPLNLSVSERKKCFSTCSVAVLNVGKLGSIEELFSTVLDQTFWSSHKSKKLRTGEEFVGIDSVSVKKVAGRVSPLVDHHSERAAAMYVDLHIRSLIPKEIVFDENSVILISILTSMSSCARCARFLGGADGRGHRFPKIIQEKLAPGLPHVVVLHQGEKPYSAISKADEASGTPPVEFYCTESLKLHFEVN